MKNQENIYGGLGRLKSLRNSLESFSLSWGFTQDEDFDKIVTQFLMDKGILNEDVFILSDTAINIESLAETEMNKVIDFGSRTHLTRIEPSTRFLFNYKNETPLVFLPHDHHMIIEKIRPLQYDMIMYLKLDGIWQPFDVKVGEVFEIPEGVLHAALFNSANESEVEWHKV